MGRTKAEQKEITVYPLGKLLAVYQSEEGRAFLNEMLSSFCCDNDKDIENFLRFRAVEFETLNKGRTYIIFDKRELEDDHHYVILGFYTVALKVLNLPDSLSNAKRKQLDGFSAKLRGEVITAIPCYLIGQIAKNSAIADGIEGSVMIDKAISTIKSGVEAVGGRYVLIECHETPYLRKFYTENGFTEFEQIPDEGVPVVQMLRPVCNT